MGFADLLLLLGIPYNSDEAVMLAEQIMAFITKEGRAASAALAKTRGAFPLFQLSTYPQETPLRNATVTTIAQPAPFLSLPDALRHRPVFAYVFIRNIMDNYRNDRSESYLKAGPGERGLYSDDLMKQIAREGTLAQIEASPRHSPHFVCSHDINPIYISKCRPPSRNHRQRRFQNGQLPSKRRGRGCQGGLSLGYELDCKGVTIYRDGSRDNQVLNIGDIKHSEAESRGLRPYHRPAPAGSGLRCYRKDENRLRQPLCYGNYDDQGICEVFTSTGKAGAVPLSPKPWRGSFPSLCVPASVWKRS